MSERCDVIEHYLDELLAGLRGDAAAVRRMLTETEEHLYADVEDGLERGMGRDDAARAAVTRFGAAAHVAQTWTASAPPVPVVALLRRLTTQLAPLFGVGLVAIGISGLLARVMTSVWGLTFMFAGPPGATYSAADCRYWLSIHPRAGSCTNAYLAESLADGLQARYAAGLCGLIVLGVLAVRRHRHRMPLISAPPPMTSLTGATLFLAAAVALTALATDAIRVSDGNGAGRWVSGAIIAFPVAVGYSLALIRSSRRPSVPT